MSNSTLPRRLSPRRSLASVRTERLFYLIMVAGIVALFASGWPEHWFAAYLIFVGNLI